MREKIPPVMCGLLAAALFVAGVAATVTNVQQCTSLMGRAALALTGAVLTTFFTWSAICIMVEAWQEEHDR